MYIKKIELDGFKSYGIPQSLEKLDTQFNAITGLNGSGKSNILDSICFVLGISQLQYIRVDKNEDLVFRKGQTGIGKATVTITFDNRDPKQKPVGYEAENTIIIRRQVMLNGKTTYHINNLTATATKVSDLFNSVSMNINNPHFLIMQGRVTKVLNMKPREILYMIEEAAGVRVYETKRRNAINTLEKKGVKIDQINDMMDQQIMPELNKRRGKRDLYNEYLKLGREIEHQQRLSFCFEFWKASTGEDRHRTCLSDLIEESKQSALEIKNIGRQIRNEKHTLEEMNKHYSETLGMQQVNLNADKRHKENELVERRDELKKTENELKDLEQKLIQQQESIAQDKIRLEKKRSDLEAFQNQHGDDATLKKEAEEQLEKCKATLAALERGLVTDDDGNEVSLSEQILNLKNKYSKNETTALRLTSHLDELRKKLYKTKSEYSKFDHVSSEGLNSKKQIIDEEIKALQAEIAKYENIDAERDEASESRKNVLTAIREKQNKSEDHIAPHVWLNFRYAQIPNFDPSEVIGVFANLIRPKDVKYSLALEIALAGILTNIVVRTQAAAARILKEGRLITRYTFIPLDSVKYKPTSPNKFDRAVQLVGEQHVFRAVDLIEFDESIRVAVEYALGHVFVCTSPSAAKTVCFDRNVMLRVVTFEGDDYRPDGFLSGGSTTRMRSVLTDIHYARRLKNDVQELKIKAQKLDARCSELQKSIGNKRKLQETLSAKNFELNEVVEKIRSDPTSRLKADIDEFSAQIEIKESELNDIRPIVEKQCAELKELEKRQKNEAAYRKNEENKARKGVEEAESTLKMLERKSSNAIEQLDLNRLDVETLTKQIQDDESTLNIDKARREPLLSEIVELKKAFGVANSQFEEIKRNFDEFMVTYRLYECELKQKQEKINNLKKEERDKSNKEENFVRERRELEEKIKDAGKIIKDLVHQHSWINDEKEHFNKPGTQYDFQDLTSRKIRDAIRAMKDRREELFNRVDMDAMSTLVEEEERAKELDEKRTALQVDRETLQKTIDEIDSEKERELDAACKKISKDFGAIFSTILPGVTADLKPVDENDIKKGLKIRVAFNNQWKDSLDELSGGQRSLVALSLILAMLKCNPAPIYILDEIDAALDLSHTANIGTMIKQHFKESQFIIVSLKEGMFNNANVLYKTQFVNGNSIVTRYSNRH